MSVPGRRAGFQPAQAQLENLFYVFSTSTRTRTRNTPLEAGHDLRFTIEAHTRRSQRKARDLNPHLTMENRLSRAARPTVSGYLPYVRDAPSVALWDAGSVPYDASVDRRGVEPRSSGCRPDVVPLDQQPLSSKEVRPGVEPGLPPYRGGVRPKHLRTHCSTQLQAPVSIRASRPYESQSGTCPACSDQGESRTPTPSMGTTF